MAGQGWRHPRRRPPPARSPDKAPRGALALCVCHRCEIRVLHFAFASTCEIRALHFAAAMLPRWRETINALLYAPRGVHPKGRTYDPAAREGQRRQDPLPPTHKGRGITRTRRAE